MQPRQVSMRRRGALLLVALLLVCCGGSAHASDHLDTPTVAADPAADIGDLYAWTSADGRRLNLVMTIVGKHFSDRLQYVFHVDSGARFGKTTTTTTVLCRFDAAQNAECWAGAADYLHGDAGGAAGLEGRNRRFRVFAGLRDDPFFNNVKGTRAAYGVASAALAAGAAVDASGCPSFDDATARGIFDHWRQTEGGPGTNLLAGWQTAALVVAIDLDLVAPGALAVASPDIMTLTPPPPPRRARRDGDLLAVWAAVYKP